MALLSFSFLIFSLLTLSLSTTTSATCATSKLKTAAIYKTCIDLPTLNSTLHYTYTAANQTLSVAFTAPPPTSTGWVAWGINPTGTGMAGTQAILAYNTQQNGAVTAKTYNISSYSSIVEGKLSFEVYDKTAELNDGLITIFTTVAVPGEGKVNHVWQVGPGMSNGKPMKHEFQPENLKSKGVLDLSSGSGTGTGAKDTPSPAPATSGGVDAATWKKNVGFLLLGFLFAVFFC